MMHEVVPLLRTIIVRHLPWAGRTAACIVSQMRKTDFRANIRVVKASKEYALRPANKLSALRLLMMLARVGDELEIFAEGLHAEEALEIFETKAYKCALAELEDPDARKRRAYVEREERRIREEGKP